eukprot:CAMPEP_0183384348 /NCGR_PEP_ID=MMETSP0370-20130417/472_1 /TAXON_ID=268820 /ORGANISM="Peridinium aciculiferum, Strain PAER-2" /LENGTH=72 /DNA_ID=CAMNT_0025562079 /DNA_START=81 /DNA_END=295 /DNA_ORIENTATION=-
MQAAHALTDPHMGDKFDLAHSINFSLGAATLTSDHHGDCPAHTTDSPIARQALHASAQTRARGAAALTMSWS